MPPRIQVQMLGRFMVIRDGKSLPPGAFGGRLPRRLLRMLALSRGTLLSKDAAAEALWPVDRPADAPGNVEILISRIRTALGDRTLIETGAGGYILAADDRCWVDTERFMAGVALGQERLHDDRAAALAAFRGALDLWHGEPLAEDAYDDWAQQHRRHLWQARSIALEGAATAALAGGEPVPALAWARAAVEQEPLRESSVVLLIRALAAAGDPAAALRTYDEYRARLATDLGVEPTAQAQALRQQVLRERTRATVPAAPDPRAGTRPDPRISSRQRADREPWLPAQAREVLALLVLLGRPAATSLLGAAAGRTLPETLRILDLLHRARLVRGEPAGWSATPAGEPALAGLDASERTRLHRQLALVLDRDGADPVELADHLVAGGDTQAAARRLAVAARARLERFADDEALQLADTGLAIRPYVPTSAALLLVRAEASRRRGRLDQSFASLREALGVLSPGPDRSRAMARLALLEARSRSAVRGGELVDLAIAEAGDDPAARGQALAAGAIIDLMLRQRDRAAQRYDQARTLLDQAGDTDGTVRLLYWRAMATLLAGRLADAVGELDDLARLPAVPEELLRLWNPRAVRGHAMVFLAEPETGLADIDQALAWADSVGHPAALSPCLWRRAEALVALDRPAEALDCAQAASAIAQRIDHAEWTAASWRGLGIAWQALGELDRAEHAFRRSWRAAEAAPLFAAWAAARLGLVLVEQGRLPEAEPAVEAALAHDVPLTLHEARWARAELLHARADPGAQRVAAEALRAAREQGYRALVPRLARLAAG